MRSAPRFYVASGEPSGDAHGAGVVRALRERWPGAFVEGTGGQQMHAAGAVLRHSIAQCAATGITESLSSLPRHLAMARDLSAQFGRGAYDAVILVDYPGLHLRLARAAHRAGVPVVYYVAPQIWAWGSHRADTLKSSTDEIALILPFEEAFFRRAGLRAEFVGHPLLDSPPPPSRAEARRDLGIENGESVVAVFPGSRPQERALMWPIFRRACEQITRAAPGVRFILAGQPGTPAGFLSASASIALAAADTAICKSGTVTIEAAMAGVPMVIAYRMHRTSYAIARLLVKSRWIGLVNLVAERSVAPELIQGRATPEAIARETIRLLDRDGAPARDQRTAFAEIVPRLGTPGAGRRVADLVARHVA